MRTVTVQGRSAPWEDHSEALGVLLLMLDAYSSGESPISLYHMGVVPTEIYVERERFGKYIADFAGRNLPGDDWDLLDGNDVFSHIIDMEYRAMLASVEIPGVLD